MKGVSSSSVKHFHRNCRNSNTAECVGLSVLLTARDRRLVVILDPDTLVLRHGIGVADSSPWFLKAPCRGSGEKYLPGTYIGMNRL